LIVALLVAPILAVLAYYALGALVGEQPQPAEEGQSYPLVEKPSCRYASGRCELENGDFELMLVPDGQNASRITLNLTSVFPLDGAMIALVDGSDDDAAPTPMRALGDDGLEWTLDLAQPDPERHRLRLVVSSGGSLYYGDVATAFTGEEHSEQDGF
jgi:hypothetical protein